MGPSFNGFVPDADVIRAALLGRDAYPVFMLSGVPLYSTASAIERARTVEPAGGSTNDMHTRLRLLPLQIADRVHFEQRLVEAKQRYPEGRIDQIEVIALALAHSIPLWSDCVQTPLLQAFTTRQMIQDFGLAKS
ncbi:MAG: hypothetical protein HYY16_16660 [Planctomycetes bacterium]|nr:hypothetical protein [Planctomycetota bacterium]